MKSIHYSFAVAAALLFLPVAYAANQAPAAAAPAESAAAPAQPAQPQASGPVKPTDVKGIGDWTVRCYPIASPSPCEMLEVRIAKKSGQRILGVLLAFIPSRNQHIIQISVPLGVALQNGLVINSDTYKSGTLHFRRCDSNGCYVETALDNNAINSLGRATKARVAVVFMDGKKYDLVFSLTGFNEAHRTLVDLTRQKAVNPPAASTPQEPAPQQ
jgi:invasion protein IalB